MSSARRRRAAGIAVDAARQLVRHPLRSLLTALTSAVAIAVTVNVISLVYGLDEDMRRDTRRFGRRTVDVTRLPVIVPGLERRPLGEAERDRIASATADLGVVVAPRRLVAGRAAGDVDVERISLVATSREYLRTLDVALAAGRFLAAGEEDARVCVLDTSAATALFPGVAPSDVLARDVAIDAGDGKRAWSVVGVLEDPITHREIFETFDEGRGARTLTSSLLSFRNVYLPERALGDGEYSGISVVAPSEDVVDEVALRLRRIWPPPEATLLPTQSVGVFVRREWMDVIGGTTQTGAFLGNIVWIIIVGVAVVMLSTLNLITIRERYDELAIRRVEGAGRNDVAWQVTVEGTLTSVLGGLAGLPLGYVGSALLRDMVSFPFRFELPYAIVATGIAVLIGLVASVLPARRAAALQPARVLSRRQT